ncbi:MAG: transposase [Candidatus Thermoplasmatota archaeon]
MILPVQESGIKNVVLIGDKSFYSEDNVQSFEDIEKLESYKIDFIFPLRRNLTIIDYSKLKKGNRREFDGFFMFGDRPIWHYSYPLNDKKKIVVFLDAKLRAEEEKDYLSRTTKEDKEKLENFFQKEFILGTIAVMTTLKEDAERIYELLKCRIEIEQIIDTFKNVLNADRTYMMSDPHLQGWMFINFISLLFYYKIYHLLTDRKLLSNYSPMEVLIHLSRVYKLKIGDKWELSEIPKKTRKILEKLNMPITQS